MAGAHNELSVAERRRRREEERRRTGEQNASGDAFDAPIEDLAHNPRNARAELEGLEGLASTYETVGLLQSCAAIPADVFNNAFPESVAEVGAARFVIVGGNRRLGAARLADRKTVPILVNRKATTRKDILVAAATENLSREELKPFEELATIEDLKKEFGTYDAVAKVLGKSPGWVSQRRRLAHLQPEVREALEQRTPGMTIELARFLGTIKDRDQQLAAWETEKELVAARETETKPDKGRGTGDAVRKPEKKTVPRQGGAGAAALDETTNARRVACLATVVDFNGDATRIHIIALQTSVDTSEAVRLATQWLIEAGIGASALSLPSLPGDEGKGRQARAALALSLAHCEIHMVRNGGNDAAHVSAYLDWLATHADYQPADDAEPALTT